MRTDTRRFRRTVVSRAAIAALCGTAAMLAAQETLAQQQQSLQRVEVTGSNIPRNEVETPSPVQVISSEQLRNSGYTTVSEVLRDITANGQGTLSTSFNAAFAGGASGVSLRGLTVGATLVLIDGHRMAPYPLSDDGERQFVDISSIPFNAVERIEVLKDGASAVYGSDAIAGVVNVILKKSFKGTLATADYGDSQHGGGKTYSFSLTHGFGAEDANNGYVALEYRKSKPIYLDQRSGPWTNQNFSGFGDPFGGEDLRPGAVNDFVPSPRLVGIPILQKAGASTSAANTIFLGPNASSCNFTAWRSGQCLYTLHGLQVQPPSENINLLASYTAHLNPVWDLNLKASIFDSKSDQVRAAPSIPLGTFAGITAIGPGITPSILNAFSNFTVPATYPGNTFGAPANVRAYLWGNGLRETDYDSMSYRFVGDLTGTVAGWDTKASAGWTQVSTKSTYRGYINYPNLHAALQDPTNPYLIQGGNSQAMQDFVSPTVSNTAKDTLEFLEARGSRELMQLGGGAMGVALGATLIHKDLNQPDPIQAQNGTMGLNGAYALGKETNYALYGELVAPVTKMLELDGAVRYDHFSTYGSSTTPKIGFKFTPAQWIGIRGTAAEGFRAPAATENGTAGALFSFNQIRDPLNCPNPANPKSAQNVAGTCSFNPTYLQTTNKNLQPEKSKSYTLGAILEPLPNLSATVDYYHIKLDNQIIPAASVAGYDPLANIGARSAPQTVTFGDGSVGTSPAGLIQWINVPYVNGQSTVTSGVELEARYRMNLGNMGKFTVGAMWTHILKYDQTLNGVTYHLAGTHGPSIIGGDTGNPKNRAQLTLQWDRGPLTIATTTNYIGGYDVTDPGNGFPDCVSALEGYNSYFSGSDVPQYFCRVRSFTYTNLTAKYRVNDKLTLRFAVDNLFDRSPPLDLQTYGSLQTNGSSNGTGIPYNPSLHQIGAVGRFFSVGVDYRF